MKKIFISQPMLETATLEDIKKERELIIAQLTHYYPLDEIEITNSIIEDNPPSDVISPSLWYLGKSIEALAKSDIIYLHTGWAERRGCRIEHECAKEYGIEVLCINLQSCSSAERSTSNES